MHYDWTADGETSLFKIGKGDYPIQEDSFTLKVASTIQTEGSDYDIDINNGLVTFPAAPTDGDKISLDFKAVELTDGTWVSIINYIINDMEGKFWKEGDDPDFSMTSDDDVEYPGPDNCLDIINIFYKRADNPDIAWTPLQEFTNWRYSEDENQIKLARDFESAYPLRVHFLKGYVRGQDAGAQLDLQDRYTNVLQFGCMWRFYDHLVGKRAKVDTKVVDEEEVSPMSTLREQSRHYQRMYESARSKQGPTKPARPMYPNNPGQPSP
jgi:hypothetical protein